MKTLQCIFVTGLISFLLIPFELIAEPYLGAGVSRVEASITGTAGGEANGFKIYGGTQVDSLGWEASYQEFGDIAIRPSDSVMSGQSFNFSMLAYLEMNPSFDWYFRLNMSLWELDIDTFLGPFNDSGSDISYGFGGQFVINKQLNFRIEYEIYDDLNSKDLDILSFNLLYVY